MSTELLEPITDQAAQIDIDRTRGDFAYPEEHAFNAGTGLSHATIDYISDVKSEPDWIREFRHKALDVFFSKPMPTHWASKDLENIVFQNIRYYLANGQKPWCIGIKSGEATGWQLTDWLEEYVLRTAGPDVYDKWVSHDVKFSDPQIAAAFKQVGDLLKNPKYVNAGIGDVNTIASTEFNDVAPLILNGQCTMAREAANFDSNYKSSKIGPDGDINAFYLPPINTQFGQVVLGGGTFWAAFADRPEVNAFMYYLATPDFANTRAQQGSWISANKGLQASSVPSPVQQTALTVLQNPDTVFRFDASDMMPAAVGSDAEWKQFTAWITGQDDATTLANIDKAWPTS